MPPALESTATPRAAECTPAPDTALAAKQPSIIIVSYHFYPSNEIGARRATALAQFLAERGVRVAVVSAFGGQAVPHGAPVLPGIIAVPVQRPPRVFTGAMIRLKRMLIRSKPALEVGDGNIPASAQPLSSSSFWTKARDLYFRTIYFVDQYKSWGRRARRAAIRDGLQHPPAVVLSSSPPPTVLWVGTLVAKRLRVPHIADLRDPWSDTLTVLHTAPTVELHLTRAIERWVMRSAAAITSTGSKTADLLVQRQPELAAKTFVVRNGYDQSVASASGDTGGRLAILFAGELYLNRDPFPLLQALERLVCRPEIDASRISATFMGRKTEFAGQSFAKWLEGKRCASVVTFMPPQPREVVAEAALRSTVLLNLAQDQPLSVPAKTFEHLASGRENLLLCEDDAESAQLVAGIPGVIQVDSRNPAALDRVLLDLYERHVNQGRLRAPVIEDIAAFSRDASNKDFWRIIQSLASVDATEFLKESTC
jgi:Glycosyl transferase 4-like domain